LLALTLHLRVHGARRVLRPALRLLARLAARRSEALRPTPRPAAALVTRTARSSAAGAMERL
jgi:hypothetical protein